MGGVIFTAGGVITAAATYIRQRHWKRVETAILLLTDVLKDPQTRNALALLDWRSREIDFGIRGQGKETGIALVDQDTLRAALLTDFREGHVFEFSQWAIRDTFDAFLNRLGLVAQAVDSRLIKEDEVCRSFGYWIDQMNGNGQPQQWERATVEALLTYIATYYAETGVPALLGRFSTKPCRERVEATSAAGR